MSIRTNLRIYLTMLMFLAVMVSPAIGKIIYVDVNAGGDNNGSSWYDAYKHLQDALMAGGQGDKIYVAEGVYRPDRDSSNPEGSGERKATFQLKSEVGIYGGFLAWGCAWEQRNPSRHKTVLSGDLKGNDAHHSKWNKPKDNCHHVVTGSGADVTAILDGFTIAGGLADDAGLTRRGGGMYNVDGGATVVNCIFTKNNADGTGTGGGMYNGDGSKVTLIGCVFKDNGAHEGSAMFNRKSTVRLSDCIFEDHYAKAGGAMENVSSVVTLTGCRFIKNKASVCGGAIFGGELTLRDCVFIGNSADSGGAIESRVTAENCRFTGNSTSGSGGAIRGGGKLSNCIFTVNSAGEGGAIEICGFSTLKNCIFVGNSAECGGAIHNWRGEMILTNCTLSGNWTAGEGGGIHSKEAVAATNCIFWGNRDNGGEDESAQIHNCDKKPMVDYCCIQGLTGQWGGIGNIKDDPLFVDAAKGDYHLLADSPCIDAGCSVDTMEDLDGKHRPWGSDYDIGSYEWAQSASNHNPIPIVVPYPDEMKYWGNRHPDLNAPPLDTAIVRSDNDFAYQQPYEDANSRTVQFPEAVRKKICKMNLEEFLSTGHEGPTKYSDLFGPVFRLQVPSPEHLHLYVCKMQRPHVFKVVLIVHDTQTNRIATEPNVSWHRWGLGRPFVYFDDLDQDGRSEVVVQGKCHYGTSAGSTFYQYFHIAEDLSFALVAVRETHVPCSITRLGRRSILRDFEAIEPNRIALVVNAVDTEGKFPTKEFGWVLFECAGPGEPFVAQERHVLDNRGSTYIDDLFTFAEGFEAFNWQAN